MSRTEAYFSGYDLLRGRRKVTQEFTLKRDEILRSTTDQFLALIDAALKAGICVRVDVTSESELRKARELLRRRFPDIPEYLRRVGSVDDIVPEWWLRITYADIVICVRRDKYYKE